MSSPVGSEARLAADTLPRVPVFGDGDAPVSLCTGWSCLTRGAVGTVSGGPRQGAERTSDRSGELCCSRAFFDLRDLCIPTRLCGGQSLSPNVIDPLCHDFAKEDILTTFHSATLLGDESAQAWYVGFCYPKEKAK